MLKLVIFCLAAFPLSLPCFGTPRLSEGLSQISQPARLAWLKASAIGTEDLSNDEKKNLNITYSRTGKLRIQPVGNYERRFITFPEEKQKTRLSGFTAMIDYEIKMGNAESLAAIEHIIDHGKSKFIIPPMFLILGTLAKKSLKDAEFLPLYFRVLSQLNVNHDSWVSKNFDTTFMEKFNEEIFTELKDDFFDFGLVTVAGLIPRNQIQHKGLENDETFQRIRILRKILNKILASPNSTEIWKVISEVSRPLLTSNTFDLLHNKVNVACEFRRIRQAIIHSPYFLKLVKLDLCSKYLDP